MSGEPYMSGRGLRAKTRELNDAAWNAVGPAFLSTCGFLFSWFPTILAWSWGPDWLAVVSSIFTAGMLAFCIRDVARWDRAIGAVKEHSRQMREETAKRGRGWAKS